MYFFCLLLYFSFLGLCQAGQLSVLPALLPRPDLRRAQNRAGPLRYLLRPLLRYRGGGARFLAFRDRFPRAQAQVSSAGGAGGG